jgi:hypothetical protein
MAFKKRIFVSTPTDDHLDTRQRELKNKILEKVVALGYEPQIFLHKGMPAGMSWNFSAVNEVMRRCQGALILGFARWHLLAKDGEPIKFPTEYNHYEGALANSRGLPILTITERGMVDRGIHWTGGGNAILFLPEDADGKWLEGESFRHRFSVWAEQLSERKDVFLGYCSQAQSVAQAVHLFISSKLKLSVLDWAMEFTGGSRILDEIQRASKLCTCGIFIFTKDDQLEGSAHQAAPRDNVVFEAGYFTSSKGKDRVLIIREEGAKMPADLGGDIYVLLPEKRDTAKIESAVRDFLERRL